MRHVVEQGAVEHRKVDDPLDAGLASEVECPNPEHVWFFMVRERGGATSEGSAPIGALVLPPRFREKSKGLAGNG